jgi:hypothetical protein
MELKKREVRFFLNIIFSLVFILNLKAQFISPVLHELRFSGLYGELRPNHFHNGIDLKINRAVKVNYALAIMDGIVRRISVAPDGYGNMLIIDHPNGYSSLYGHLDRFSPDIESFVREYQLINQTFEVNLDSLNIPVSQGQIIGVIGNSGASNGPHLHFEVLNSNSGNSYNPLIFGIKGRDTISPVLQKLKIVGLDNEFNDLNSKTLFLKKIKADSFGLNPDTVMYGASQIGIEIMGYDQVNGSTNHNGIYKITMVVDSVPVSAFRLENMEEDLLSCYKAHIDYKEYLKSGNSYHRLFVLPGNDLNIYSIKTDNSVIKLDPDTLKIIEVIAEDYFGNKSYLQLKVMMDSTILRSDKISYNHYIPMGQKYEISDPDYKILIDENCFFKNTYLSAIKSDSTGYSPSVNVSINRDAFKNKIDLFIKPLKIDQYADKMCIVRIDGGKKKNLGGVMRDGYMYAKIGEEGTYKILVDNVKPTVKPRNLKTNMKKSDRIIFSISDNFSSGITVPHLKADGYIDGEWVLFEYDKKYKNLTHKFDKNLKPGKHSLKLIVSDTKGNAAEYNKTFIK